MSTSDTGDAATTSQQQAQSQPGTLWPGQLEPTERRDAAEVHTLDAAGLDAWLDSLKPPPGTWPSLGSWPREQPPWRQDVQWLDSGNAMIRVQGLPMSRELGAYSTCLTYGKKLGAPAGCDRRVDEAWNRADPVLLRGRALEFVVEIDMADASSAQRERAREELEELFDPRQCFAKLRRFAREFWRAPEPMHPQDTPYCWAWDAWAAHEQYSTIWVVSSAMGLVMEAMEWDSLIDPPNNLACVVDGPGCAQHFNLCMRDSSWRSLHPCMHWLCGECADKWFVGRRKNTCPICRTDVLFWSEF